MSARHSAASSARDALFTGRAPTGRSDVSVPAPTSEAADCMELEHVIGYNAKYHSTAAWHPGSPHIAAFGMGAVVVVQDVTDAHNQSFLRGHDANVCVVVMSHTGAMIASAQVSSPAHPGDDAAVIVWNTEAKSHVFVLDGLKSRVEALAFSPDSAFLAASDSNGAMILWDMRTGELVTLRRQASAVTTLCWGPMTGDARRPAYTLAATHGAQVTLHSLAYDVRAQHYVMAGEPCVMPASGFIRDYTAACVDHTGEFLLLGTMTGEVCVFSLRSRMFRASVPLVSHGVGALCLRGSSVWVGGGDGSLRELVGSDMSWAVKAEARVAGGVCSLSTRSDGAELLVGARSGQLLRLALQDMTVSEVTHSHLAPITAVAFGTRSDVVATAAADGGVRLWDLSDYTVISEAHGPCAATCLAFASDGLLVAGWKDGALRVFDAADGRLVFELPHAHRGGVTAVAVSDAFIVSGGEDARVRVWTRRGRYEVVMEFAEHRRRVSKVLVDTAEEHVVHSCSTDNTVMSYDLRKERRTTRHMLPDTSFSALTQRRDSERELLTACTDGRILCWDRDYTHPVEPAMRVAPQPTAMAMSMSGLFLAVAADNQYIHIFDIKSGRQVASYHGHSAPVLDVQWSPDGKQLISVGEDCAICVWNFYGAS